MTSKVIHSVNEARVLSKKVLPRVVFDYIEGGADDEITMKSNVDDFNKVRLLQKVDGTISDPELSTDVLGKKLSFPLVLAPCGLVRVMHPDGGIGVAKAAKSAGIQSVLSTVSGNSIEEVASVADSTLWFQLYSAGGRDESKKLIDKAEKNGVDTLVVTVDTPALGNRERDRNNGVTTPLRITPDNVVGLGLQVLSKPVWTGRMVQDGVKVFNKTRSKSKSKASRNDGKSMLSMAASPFSWEEIKWIREYWNHKLVIKGLMDVNDGLTAASLGVDGIVVSNHGGRQLDSSPSTISVLPDFVKEIGGKLDVLVDGGVRRGTHIAKALSLGADAVMIGRPYLYGLSVSGEQGVSDVISALKSELKRSLILLGCKSVSELRSQKWLAK